MNFDEFEYERPDLDDFRSTFESLLNRINDSASVDEQISAIDEINELRDRVNTLRTLARVRHTQDTTDDRWKEEQEFFDENGPVFQELYRSFYEALIDSPFRDELEQTRGQHLFRIAELEIQTFDPIISEESTKENQLTTDYQQVIASAEIDFHGETLNLAGLAPYQKTPDRDTRREASEKKWQFYDNHRNKLDRLYDDLVDVRGTIASKLGYENAIELGYDRMGRMEYGPDDVERLRNIIVEHIVPLAVQLKERQRNRLDLDELHHYDEQLYDPSGNPEPKGSPEWIVDQAESMYDELSPETSTFFSYMRNNDLMDLVTRKGKAGGGYCTYFPLYNAPFIFSNFNGTDDDVRVLTHEVGHAFQKYLNRNKEVSEYRSPTADTAEIHSMSMEFFTRPWMDQFFEEDADRYREKQLAHSIRFLPYGSCVDHFQHAIYDQPDLSPDERKTTWHELEERYLPARSYDGNAFLEEGGYWQSQRHIYKYPFYYIDYVLARICALQIWSRARSDRDAAWETYMDICRTGGDKPFLKIIKDADLISPFDKKWVDTVLPEVKKTLFDSP